MISTFVHGVFNKLIKDYNHKHTIFNSFVHNESYPQMYTFLFRNTTSKMSKISSVIINICLRDYIKIIKEHPEKLLNYPYLSMIAHMGNGYIRQNVHKFFVEHAQYNLLYYNDNSGAFNMFGKIGMPVTFQGVYKRAEEYCSEYFELPHDLERIIYDELDLYSLLNAGGVLLNTKTCVYSDIVDGLK